MQYKVYTDGSKASDGKVAGIAYFIYTTTRFIYLGGRQVRVKTVRAAEELAVVEALKYVMQNLAVTRADTVLIYSDCLRLVEDLKMYKYVNTRFNLKCMEISGLIKVIQELEKKCDWEIVHVKGHSKIVNGNSLVDRVAKYYMTLRRNSCSQ